jgi:hypothetical protein
MLKLSTGKRSVCSKLLELKAYLWSKLLTSELYLWFLMQNSIELASRSPLPRRPRGSADRTAEAALRWLERQDSNLGMAESKSTYSAFDFKKIARSIRSLSPALAVR